MRLVKGKDIVELDNPGTISAYLQEGYAEYAEPFKKPRKRSDEQSDEDNK